MSQGKNNKNIKNLQDFLHAPFHVLVEDMETYVPNFSLKLRQQWGQLSSKPLPLKFSLLKRFFTDIIPHSLQEKMFTTGCRNAIGKNRNQQFYDVFILQNVIPKEPDLALLCHEVLADMSGVVDICYPYENHKKIEVQPGGARVSEWGGGGRIYLFPCG